MWKHAFEGKGNFQCSETENSSKVALLSSLTRDTVLTFPLHLQRLHIDAPVPNKACAGDAPVWLTETFLMGPGKHKTKIRFKWCIYTLDI